MKKRVLVVFIIVIIILAAAAGAAGYFYNNENDPVIICNGLEISESLYTIYFIDEANKINDNDNDNDYDNYGEYLKQVRENVFDQICIDSYYQTKCNEEEIVLTEEEEQSVEMAMISKLAEFGFDYDAPNDDLYREYFNITKDDIKEYYMRKTLYSKYFSIKSSRSSELLDSRQIRRISSLKERIIAQNNYTIYQREQRLLTVAIDKYFEENRWEYANNSVEFVFLEYPKNENGEIISDNLKEYGTIADRIRTSMDNGAYYHTMPQKYSDYVTNIGFMFVDKTSTVAELYSEEFLRICLEGTQDVVYRVDCDTGIAVIKIYKVSGKDENRAIIESEVKKKEIANQVRKAILEEKYEPQIVNMDFYNSFEAPKGKIWEKLLE